MRAFDARTQGAGEREALAGLEALRGPSGDDAALDAAVLAAIPLFPLKIQLQTWTRCNAACEMCPYPEITGEPGFRHERMEEDVYREILRQLAGRGVERLSLFLMNEPLLDRRLPAWIALARQALPGVTLGLFSNGSPLTEALALALAEAGLDELCLSMHGFDAATYDAVMRGLAFERVAPRVRRVLELQAAGALGGMTVQVVAGDLPELRASLVSADALIRRHTVLKAFSNERAVSAVTAGLPSSTIRPAAGLCQRPFVKLYVLANGDCVLCNADWRRTEILGRVGPEPEGQIAAIWAGARYRAVRRAHLRASFAAGHVCAGCDYPAVVEGDG